MASSCILQSQNDTPELNYNIYNKELLGIVVVLKKWKVFLQNTKEPFVVKTDYKNLTSFFNNKGVELETSQIG